MAFFSGLRKTHVLPYYSFFSHLHIIVLACVIILSYTYIYWFKRYFSFFLYSKIFLKIRLRTYDINLKLSLN